MQNTCETSSCNQPFTRRINWWSLLLCMCVTFMLWSMPSSAETTDRIEAKVMAEYLLNFAKFVEWPDDVLVDGDANLILGVLGSDDFALRLSQVVQGKSVKDHRLSVRLLSKPSQYVLCHIVFFESPDTTSEPIHVPDSVTVPVLTVGESPGFIEQGGMIQFVRVGSRISFDINLSAAEEAGLKIRSRLLKVARHVIHQDEWGQR